ncbi:hypothetical protein Tco_0577349, partial [Tanacetum coccineum]
DGAANRTLFRIGKSASGMGSLGMGDDGSCGDGIMGKGVDKRNSRDGGSDGDVGAVCHASMCASMDGGKGD